MPVYIEKSGDLVGCYHSGTDDGQTRKDRATQPTDHGLLRWAIKTNRWTDILTVGWISSVKSSEKRRNGIIDPWWICKLQTDLLGIPAHLKRKVKTALFVISQEKCISLLNGPIQILATPASSCISWPKYLIKFCFDGFVHLFVLKTHKALFGQRKCSKNCSGPARAVQRTPGRMKLTSRNLSTLIFQFQKEE